MLATILGSLLGLGCLGLAYRCAKVDKYVLVVPLAVLAAAGFFGAMPWFQGFIKTQLVSILFSTTEKLGKKMDDFQTTIAKMQTELADHQAAIDKQHKNLQEQQGNLRSTHTNLLAQATAVSNAVHQVSAMQNGLASTQTNLDAQEKKLGDVEYWVSNLFSKKASDTIKGDDTSRVGVMAARGRVFFKLSSVPIYKSIEILGLKEGYPNAPIIVADFQFGNVVSFAYGGSWDLWKAGTFHIQYVQDTRVTNLIQSIETQSNALVLDGQTIFLP